MRYLTDAAAMQEPFTSKGPQDDISQDYLASFPFLPNQFYSELPLPRAMEAASHLICTSLTHETSLSRGQKEMVLRGLGTLLRNNVCALCFKQAPAAASAQDRQLLKFSLKLGRFGPLISSNDVELLGQAGFDEPAILEAIITTAVGRMFCTLADGLVPPPVSVVQLTHAAEQAESPDPVESNGPYLKSEPSPPDDFPPCKFFRERFGFVPNVYRAQALRPDILQAEGSALEAILVPQNLLSRLQKENILLAVSAKNSNTYFVAVHSEILNSLGISPEKSDQIVADYRSAAISEADKSLLDFACNLTNPGPEKTSAQDLSEHGFTDAQIVEAIAMAAFTNFLNTVQFGLGAVPDFPPRQGKN